MSLINKKTHCFHCGEPIWVEGKFEPLTNGSMYASKQTTYLKIDKCSKCQFSKETFSTGEICYLTDKGEATNLMSNDPRSYQ